MPTMRDAAYCRRRAAEIRTAAQAIDDPERRATLEEMATIYDRAAAQAEQRVAAEK